MIKKTQHWCYSHLFSQDLLHMFVGNIHSCAFLTHNRFSDCTEVLVYLWHHAFLSFFYGLSRGKKKLRTQKWSMIHSYQMLPAIICSFIDRKKSRGFDTSLQWPTFLTSYIHMNGQSIYPIGQTWKVTLKISIIAIEIGSNGF